MNNTGLDLCKSKSCPLKKRCARYNPGGRGFFFHPQYHDGYCILFVPKSTKPHHKGQILQDYKYSQ